MTTPTKIPHSPDSNMDRPLNLRLGSPLMAWSARMNAERRLRTAAEVRRLALWLVFAVLVGVIIGNVLAIAFPSL